MKINAAARLSAASKIHCVPDVLCPKVVPQLTPMYEVGRDAYAFRAVLPEAEMASTLRKLSAFKFRKASASKQFLPIAGTAGTKSFISWDPRLSAYPTKEAEGWAVVAHVIPERENFILLFQLVKFPASK